MATIPSTVPTRIIQGNTVQFTQSFPDYLPSAGWALVFTLINSTAKITMNGADQGDGSTFLITATSTNTAAFTPGKYRYQAKVTKSGSPDEVHTVLEQAVGEWVEVVADFAAQSSSYDVRHQLEKDLEAVEAFIAGKSEVASYTVRDRALQYYSHTELLEVRQTLIAAIAREKKAQQLQQGIGGSRKVRTRFV